MLNIVKGKVVLIGKFNENRSNDEVQVKSGIF